MVPDLPEYDDILRLMEELQDELPKSKQGVKAAGRRARKILVKIRKRCPVVRRELLDSVVYPVEGPQANATVQDEEAKPVDSPTPEQLPPKKPRPRDEQVWRGIDLRDDLDQ